MSEIITCPTGLIGRNRGMKVREEQILSDRFARYAFNVQVDVPLSPTERRQIRAVVDYLKPAHTHFVDLIDLGPPPTFDHWELGISELGVSTDLH